MSSPCYRGASRPGNAASPARSSPTELRDGATRIPARCGGGALYSLPCARAATSASVSAATEAPHRGHTSNNDSDWCCGVAQLLHSRIPTATDTTSINRRAGIFSRINSSEAARGPPVPDTQPRVYRSTFEWARVGEAGVASARRVAVRPKPPLPAGLRRGDAPPTPHRRKAARTSDKTERLRELTERLKGGERRTQPTPPPPPQPPLRTKHARMSAPTEKPPPDDDIFECVNLRLPKPESRTIVGSYIQRSIPIRSASFSQVDFCPADGKYIRSSARASPYACPAPATGGSLTLPRKRPEHGAGSSTPSVDSAVGSDEGLQDDAGPKSSGSRSLTYPLPRRGSRSDDDIPFTSIDGNGLKSLLYAPGRELQEVAEESEDSGLAGNVCSGDKVADTPVGSSLAAESISDGLSAKCCVSETSANDKTLNAEHAYRPDSTSVREYTAHVVSKTVEYGKDEEDCVTDLQAVEPSEPVEYLTEIINATLDSAENANEVEAPPSKICNDVISEELSHNVEKQPSVFITQWPIENVVSLDVVADSGNLAAEVDVAPSSHENECERPNTSISGTVTDDSPSENAVQATSLVFEDVRSKRREAESSLAGAETRRSFHDDASSSDAGRRVGDVRDAAQSQGSSGGGSKMGDGTLGSELSERRRTSERPHLTCQSSEERDDDVRRFQRADSLSEGDSDQGSRTRRNASAEMSDSDGARSRSPQPPRRYSKRPLRGPYGQMLEAEMQKPQPRAYSKFQCTEDLKFLEELSPSVVPRVSPPPTPTSSQAATPEATVAPAPAAQLAVPHAGAAAPSPRPRALTAHSLDDSQLRGGYGRRPTTPAISSAKRKVSGHVPKSAPTPCHQRTTSSPSQLERIADSHYKGSKLSPNRRASGGSPSRRDSVAASSSSDQQQAGSSTTPRLVPLDTRTHVAVEILETERSYVESLQVLVLKYLKQLKSPENAGLVDAALVDEIFYQIPSILSHHELFLAELQKKLDEWDQQQTVGDVFVEAFTKQHVIDMYTSFINNWKSAKDAVKATCQAKPAFAKFLETMAREHKGKLALDSLLIMPVQRIPRYELLLQTLIKHTEQTHPDYNLLLSAQHEIHVLAVRINCTERESVEAEQQQATLRELETVIEGSSNFVSPDRTFLRFELVTVAGEASGERGLFLFNDMLIVTTVKRRSGAIRKPSTILPSNLIQQLEGNKHRLLMRIPLEDIDIIKLREEVMRELLLEMEQLAADAVILTQLGDLTGGLHSSHAVLDDIIREMLCVVNKQLSDCSGSDSKLSHIEFTINLEGGATETLEIVFSSQDKKNEWEDLFKDAKQKLALSAEQRGSPEFVLPLPIRKTRAGLQFTCAAPTLGTEARDVWVCNSDGYVGQVCVLSLNPEPTVVSCNGVCNSRILCIASVPATESGSSQYGYGPGNIMGCERGISISVEDADEGNAADDSSSSSDDESESEDCAATEEETKTNIEDDISMMGLQTELATSTVTTAAPSEDADIMQPTIWLGTEDGCIHVYNSTDNIRIKKNKVKIQHGSSVHCIIYLDNRVFVSLANGDISVYTRESNGGWNTADPITVGVGTAAMPVTRMLPIGGRLWCGCHNTIKILNTSTLNIEHSFQVNSDSTRAVTGLALSGMGVWIALQNSAVIRLFHCTSYECLCDVNVAPAVTKMLQSCDDIIRQHKAACLRVTALLACKDLLWIGTSAGVILNMRLPHVTTSTTRINTIPTVSGMPHGHTGHVRFLTCVETRSVQVTGESSEQQGNILTRQMARSRNENRSSTATLLVISGGDGYEDFRTSSVSEVAGREDSTNHLLLWLV